MAKVTRASAICLLPRGVIETERYQAASQCHIHHPAAKLRSLVWSHHRTRVVFEYAAIEGYSDFGDVAEVAKLVVADTSRSSIYAGCR